MQSGNVAAPGDALFHRRNGGGYLRTGNVPNRMTRVRNAHTFAFIRKDKLPLTIHYSVPEKFWLTLLKAAERTDLVADGRFKTRDRRRQNFEALERTLMPTFRTKTRDEWLKRLEANDVPVAPLCNIAEAMPDRQVRHLGLTQELEHANAGKLTFIDGPVKYDNLNKKISTPPPLLGEQTVAILSQIGYGQEAIDEFAAKGITRIVKD